MAEVLTEIYDHEVEDVLQTFYWLREKCGSSRNYEAFEREIRDRFAKIGFTVIVNWYEYEIGGVKQDGVLPDVTVSGRIEKHEFDHDQQVAEATRNILGIPGQEGVIRTDDSGVFKQMKDDLGPH